MATTTLKPTQAKEWVAWLQEFGPGTSPAHLPVHVLDDFDVSEGGGTAFLAQDPATGELFISGVGRGAPELIEISLTADVIATPNKIERMLGGQGRAALIVVKNTCGRLDLFNNWTEQAFQFWPLTRINRGGAGIAQPEDNPKSTMPFTLEALQAAHPFEATVGAQTSSESNALNDIAVDPTFDCDSEKVLDPENYMVSSADAVGAGTANVIRTTNKGTTWAAVAADPFAADEHIMPIISFKTDKNNVRTVVGRGVTDPLNPAEIAYTDDEGATWTTANVGAVNGEFFVRPKTIWAASPTNIWAVTDGGYIYYSSDSGLTWTAQDSAGITSGQYGFVHGIDEKNVIAGAQADVIVVSTDGGTSWTQKTATGNGGDILCGVMITKQQWIVGTDDGELFKTWDGGETWTELTGFTGTGTGQVRSIAMADELNGFMAWNNATPVGTIYQTIDGGFNWRALTTPTNTGLNSLALIPGRKDQCQAVGEGGIMFRVAP